MSQNAISPKAKFEHSSIDIVSFGLKETTSCPKNSEQDEEPKKEYLSNF